MEAERGEGGRLNGRGWTGALVARDADFTGGVGRVVSEPGGDGVAWVYWGAGNGERFETREVVVEMVRLDLDPEFMRAYKRSNG